MGILFNNEHKPKSNVILSENLLDDMEIKEFLHRYFDHPEQYLTCDIDSIKERNEICKALIENDELTVALQNFCDVVELMNATNKDSDDEPINTIHRIIFINDFFNAVDEVIKEIEANDHLSPYFNKVHSTLRNLIIENFPLNFKEIIEMNCSGVENPAGISYHVKFDDDVSIDSIAITGIHCKKYKKLTILKRIMAPDKSMYVNSLLSLDSDPASDVLQVFSPDRKFTNRERFQNEINNILILQSITLKKQIISMERNILHEIEMLTDELHFALGMVQYSKALDYRCFADIAKPEDRLLHVNEAAHPLLSERAEVVTNNILIQNGSDFILLGGINQGGKTSYLRTIGAIQIFFQMGLPLPARYAKISPVSGIYAVFSRKEKTDFYKSKFEDELIELRDNIENLDKESLFLCNEPISGTSFTESYFLSRDALCMIKSKCARGIWVTHLYELFDDVNTLNNFNFGSCFACMKTDTLDNKFTYKITHGIPVKNSGAQEMFELRL